MAKINTVYIFKDNSKNKGKYVLIRDLNTWHAIKYIQEKYGDDISGGYPMSRRDFIMITNWKPCLYEECKDRVVYGKDIIRRRRLQCLEVVEF